MLSRSIRTGIPALVVLAIAIATVAWSSSEALADNRVRPASGLYSAKLDGRTRVMQRAPRPKGLINRLRRTAAIRTNKLAAFAQHAIDDRIVPAGNLVTAVAQGMFAKGMIPAGVAVGAASLGYWASVGVPTGVGARVLEASAVRLEPKLTRPELDQPTD